MIVRYFNVAFTVKNPEKNLFFIRKYALLLTRRGFKRNSSYFFERVNLFMPINMGERLDCIESRQIYLCQLKRSIFTVIQTAKIQIRHFSDPELQSKCGFATGSLKNFRLKFSFKLPVH